MADHQITAEVSGSVWKILVAEGDSVELDDEIMILECMKMEIPVFATAAGVVKTIAVAEADNVLEEQVLAIVQID